MANDTISARTPGRRFADHFRQKSWWVLAIGVLMQGGFLMISQRLITMGEDQLNRERTMLVLQHTELVQAIRDQTIAVRELSEACRK